MTILTVVLAILIVVSAIFAVAHSTLGKARERAAGEVASNMIRDLNMYMTLTGHIQKVQGAPVWGKLLSPNTMCYRVITNAVTGQVQVQVTQLDRHGNPGKQDVRLTLDGSCFQVADTLRMQAQARQFVADCAREYLTPLVDRKSAQESFTGLLDKLAKFRK